ncbi:Pyoverdine/dityrosine biosynthesis protein-domain-containing protein [Tricladium varicosporioides]|nr:Pyoverdine/dityrosine biosynthesis protein-domain-containing protein [Hymenoscyphus varicosporioides]
MRLHLLPGIDHPPSHLSQLQAQQIVELFNRRLRHTSTNDQWEFGGREYFKDRIYYYTSRELPCEFCLPAFPCKSSNPNKVMGSMPDRGEEMGLLKLHGFAREVEEIYPPGAKVWIISDGHVFSDCIGVGDDIVDSYTSKLVEMNNRVSAEQVSNRVKFASLVDLFDLKNSYEASNLAQDLNIPGINHYVDTCLEDEAELCRCILMSGCQSDRAALRKKIDSGDPAILALYRGFSRFMLEDLELHPATKNMTKSQRKKLSVKVSFEMIMRNQAYSNLVELLFPDHVRLSIHAHNNSGPKFGIQLFEKEFCKPIGMLSQSAEAGFNSDDLLHIPTPWHNCVVEVTGDPNIYVGKSKVIIDALSKGLYKGSWKEGRREKAGHFQVERLETASAPMPAMKTEDRHEKTGLTVILAFMSRNGANLYRYSFGFGISLYKRLISWVPRY